MHTVNYICLLKSGRSKNYNVLFLYFNLPSYVVFSNTSDVCMIKTSKKFWRFWTLQYVKFGNVALYEIATVKL